MILIMMIRRCAILEECLGDQNALDNFILYDLGGC